jgi:hypothetical protein
VPSPKPDAAAVAAVPVLLRLLSERRERLDRLRSGWSKGCEGSEVAQSQGRCLVRAAAYYLGAAQCNSLAVRSRRVAAGNGKMGASGTKEKQKGKSVFQSQETTQAESIVIMQGNKYK